VRRDRKEGGVEWSVDRERFLQPGAGTPQYTQIAAAFAAAISAGRLPIGARLPTVRRLSLALGVGSATVAAAYKLLAMQGWARGEVGRGTFVVGMPRAHPEGPQVARPSAPSTPPARRPASRPASPWRRRALHAVTARFRSTYPALLDCTSGRPDTSLLPHAALRRAWHAAIEATDHAGLQYGSPEPIPALTRVLVPRLMADMIPVREPDLVIGSSAQQWIGLTLGMAAALSGRTPFVVAVEEPGYQTAYDTIERAGYRMIGIAVDEHGAVPASLDAALRAGAHAVLFTPRVHNPTGASWTPDRVAALADVLAAHPDVIAIEDDHLADLASGAPGSLLHDRRVEERVVYIRSFAKAIAPDLRLAAAVARPRLRAMLAEAKSFADGWSSHLTQQVLANVLADAGLPEALAAARGAYAARRAAALAPLTAQLTPAGGTASGSDGLNIWVHLPPGADALGVIEHAAARGVLVAPGEPFFIQPGHDGVVRLSIGQVSTEQAVMAASILAQAAVTTVSTIPVAISV
jgi:DNA-binding transcriptional MocR family regulator